MKPILLFASVGATLLAAIYLLTGRGETVSSQPKKDVADNGNPTRRAPGNDRDKSDNDDNGTRRNGGGNSPVKQNGDASIGEKLPWLDPQDTFEKRMQELEQTVAAESVDRHDIGRVRAIIPDGLTDSEKHLKQIEADFPDEKMKRVRACVIKAIEIISKRLTGRITASEDPTMVSATTYSLESAISLLHRVASSEDFELFQQYFLQFSEGQYEGQHLLVFTLLSVMADLNKEKTRIWVTGILSSRNDNRSSLESVALILVKDHYRSEDFIPYIRTIAANHPRPPEIVEDKGQEEMTYQVQLKDTLWTIAEKFYDGRRDLSTVIAEANKEVLTGQWGRSLPPKVGQTLRIPRLTKETINGMSMEEFDRLYNSILETLDAIGTEEARRLIDAIRNSEAMRHRK